jgi:uncharacterized damage-inducible protein DinB
MINYTGKDLARSFRTVRENTIQIANDISEDRYSFRATPDTRTVSEMLAHISGLSGWQRQLHGVDKKTFMSGEDFRAYIGAANQYTATLKSKADLIRALETDGHTFATFLESLTDATLAETVSFPPPLEPSKKTRFEMLLGVKEHEMHHRGQLMLVERIIGLVPHLTRERMAGQAQAREAQAREAQARG